MSRWQNSVRNLKATLSVLKNNKKLLFMLVSNFLVMMCLWMFMALVFFGGLYSTDFNVTAENALALQIYVFSVLVIGGVLSIFFSCLCGVAFYNEVFAAFNGQGVSLRRGYKAAFRRWPVILGWAIFSATVGLIIRLASQFFGIFGRLAGNIFGFAWAVCTVFVLPIIIHEYDAKMPWKLLSRSGGIIRKTWGEALIGVGGVTFFGMIAAFIILLPAMITAWYVGFATGSMVWLFSIIIPAILLVMVLNIIVYMLQQIYVASLYVYATEGVIPEGFTQENMDNAWRVKKNDKK